MALYYPPKQGFKGWRPQHWPDGNIPETLGDAIMAAKNAGEAIYNSGNEWLILDDFGNPPSANNMEWQPESQLRFTNWYNTPRKSPVIIDIESKRTFVPGIALNPNSWFSLNWKWAVPLGAALLLFLMLPERRRE